MSVFAGHDISLNKYHYVFYSFSKSEPNTLKAQFYDSGQNLLGTQNISFSQRNIPAMLTFLENSQSNPYALGKSPSGFRNMDIAFSGIYKKALKDSQQQSLMTYINKTFKNVYSNAVTVYDVKVNSSTMTNSVDYVLTFGGLTQTQFDAILSSNGFSSSYNLFNYSHNDSSHQQYFPTPGHNVPVLTDVSYGSAISFLTGNTDEGFIEKTYTTADISENTIIQIHYGANELQKDNGWAPSYVYHKTSSQSEFTEIDSTSDIYKNFQYTINPGDTVRIEEEAGGVLLYAIVLSKLDSTNTLKYMIDDVEQPNLVATQIGTYIFDQSDPSNSGHLLKFRNLSDSTTPYTTNVTHEGTPGTPNSYSIIDVTQDTPDLQYYCEVHTGSMYGEFKTLTDLTSYRVKVIDNILGDPVFALSPPGTDEYYNQIDVSFGAGDKLLFDISQLGESYSLVFGTEVDVSSTIQNQYFNQAGDVIVLSIPSDYSGNSLKYFDASTNKMSYSPYDLGQSDYIHYYTFNAGDISDNYTVKDTVTNTYDISASIVNYNSSVEISNNAVILPSSSNVTYFEKLLDQSTSGTITFTYRPLAPPSSAESWHLIFRQTKISETDYLWSVDPADNALNADDPTNDNFSVLNTMNGTDAYKFGNYYLFRYVDPVNSRSIEFIQTSNFVTTYNSVTGYALLDRTDTEITTFTGLAGSSNVSDAWYDGKNPDGDWWHALAVKNWYGNGIPAFTEDNGTSKIELYAYSVAP